MSEAFSESEIHNIPVHILPTNKYKTTFMSLYLRQPLMEEHHTKVALIPQILQRATQKYATSQKLHHAMDDLYGANIHMDVLKKGEEQIIAIRFQIANERFLSDTSPLMLKGLQLLKEMMFHPLLEEGVFSSEVVQLEKKLLRQHFAQMKDDKIRYANKRCVEEMFADEPYRLYARGEETQLNNLTEQSIYDYYEQMMESSPLECFIIGDVQQEEVHNALQDFFPEWDGKRDLKAVSHTSKKMIDVQSITEHTSISQGKLHMGYRTNTHYADDDYIPMVVANGIFGGYPHSKLFQQVREQHSLAYYVTSILESHKGFMMIMSGIEPEKKDQAMDIIAQQIKQMNEGHISDEEMSHTKSLLFNQVQQAKDQPFQYMDQYYNGIIAGVRRDSEQFMQDIEKVTLEQAQQAFQKIQLDTVYFLTTEAKGETPDEHK